MYRCLCSWNNYMGMTNRSVNDYQFEDFVTDESFINYCRRSNPDNIAFWENWIIRHPEKAKLLEKAEYYVRNFSITLPEDEYQEEFVKIKTAIEPSFAEAGFRYLVKFLERNNPLKMNGSRRGIISWLVPALIVLLAGWHFIIQRPAHTATVLVENFNSGTIPLVFSLPDSTVITLAPLSRLKYPRRFDLELRKVYLNGNASFHVTVNTSRPFKVYQDDLVATVLGTEFNIRKGPGDSTMVVELISGSLGVEIMGASSVPVLSIRLQPNERVVYSPIIRQLSKEKWQPRK